MDTILKLKQISTNWICFWNQIKIYRVWNEKLYHHILGIYIMTCELVMIMIYEIHTINSLASGKCGCNYAFFKHTAANYTVSISYETASRWMPQDNIDDESALVQVMACCLMATSHYLNQCWPSSLRHICKATPPWVITFDFQCPQYYTKYSVDFFKMLLKLFEIPILT